MEQNTLKLVTKNVNPPPTIKESMQVGNKILYAIYCMWEIGLSRIFEISSHQYYSRDRNRLENL